MPKRAATSELNHFNWNQEEEPEEECEAPKIANPEVMSKRVIKTGKRRITSSTPSALTKPAFSNFAGFGGSTNTSNTDIKSTFSFLSNSNTSAFSNKNGISASKTDHNSKEGGDSNGSNSNSNVENEYLSKLKGLNETVFEWIKIHVGKNPTCILTPIFNDYDKYLKEIQSERSKKKSDGKTETGFATTIPTTFASSTSKPFFTNSFNSRNDSPKGDATTKSEIFSPVNESSTIHGQTSLASPLTIKKDNGPSMFASPASTIGTMLNKNPSSLFENSPFSCGNVATPVVSKNEGEEKDDLEPPRNVFERVTEEGAVYSQRVKLFLKKKDNFVDNGVGTLYIKPVDNTDSKYQAIVRADTNLGNILLNIILKESVPSKRVGKNNVMIVCILEVDKEFKSVPVLLRVKTEQEADKLLEQINKYKK